MKKFKCNECQHVFDERDKNPPGMTIHELDDKHRPKKVEDIPELECPKCRSLDFKEVQ